MASVLCGNHSNHVVKINWITRENPAKVDRSNYWFNSVGVKVIGYISIRKYVCCETSNEIIALIKYLKQSKTFALAWIITNIYQLTCYFCRNPRNKIIWYWWAICRLMINFTCMHWVLESPGAVHCMGKYQSIR